MHKHLYNVVLITLLFMASSVGFVHANPTFPQLSGQVVDQAGLLDDAEERSITAQLAAHEAQTSNQIVLVTVNSLEGYDDADYALRLGREWGIGTEENNNGVILLVAPNERKVRIEVGYGLEGALPDALAGQIISRNILPSFKENDYPSGIKNGIDSILQAVVGEYKAPAGSTKRRNPQGRLFDFIPLFFMAVIAIPAIFRSRGMHRIANAAFPAAFGGLMGTVMSGSFLIGGLVCLAAFGFMYFVNPNINSGGGGPRGPRGGGFGGGSMGGGFSGGGGSFGGGGASGSW